MSSWLQYPELVLIEHLHSSEGGPESSEVVVVMAGAGVCVCTQV